MFYVLYLRICVRLCFLKAATWDIRFTSTVFYAFQTFSSWNFPSFTPYFTNWTALKDKSANRFADSFVYKPTNDVVILPHVKNKRRFLDYFRDLYKKEHFWLLIFYISSNTPLENLATTYYTNTFSIFPCFSPLFHFTQAPERTLYFTFAGLKNRHTPIRF